MCPSFQYRKSDRGALGAMNCGAEPPSHVAHPMSQFATTMNLDGKIAGHKMRLAAAQQDCEDQTVCKQPLVLHGCLLTQRFSRHRL
ncbi:hypothetical protein ADL26_02750 [Thermoactinomyces vulgaris]|nr:hypothetical protein ADL26_02750 [Thermoactinomyces vulgaris]